MSDSTNVHRLDMPQPDQAADVRKALADSVDFILGIQGRTLSGFALVAWDHLGQCIPVPFVSDRSPISEDWLPVYVQGRLAEQITLQKTVQIVETTEGD